MPGIDPYVDFVIGEIFSSRLPEIIEVIQRRLLRLSCLDFIATCLDTFNEDLVIFASRSNVAVDLAISTSTLENYVLLHPFSRVMEWMFNDKVMAALFATVHQDAAERHQTNRQWLTFSWGFVAAIV
ncbi:putative Nucleoporin [Glarea lozoyensis 74030]|uniref:Putative Nucleoporin n=1 Tax=Glarea lozoyensis (strain ATCC 74030 / MF5533) TaxID=1104152 RepID=H0EXW9_GLAL7|nr:putative Nucleoporin [Glarea lozoyensis 74030]